MMTKNLTLHGLKKCSTCTKAKEILEAKGYQVEMHDVREKPLAAAQIADLLETFGDKLRNRASLTWRGLSSDEQSRPIAELLIDHPSLMKRPLIAGEDTSTLGWTKATRATWGIEE